MNMKVQGAVLQGFDGPFFPLRLKLLENYLDLLDRGEQDISRVLELMSLTVPVAGFIEMRDQPRCFWNLEYKTRSGRVVVLSSESKIALYQKGVVDGDEVEQVVERLLSAARTLPYNLGPG